MAVAAREDHEGRIHGTREEVRFHGMVGSRGTMLLGSRSRRTLHDLEGSEEVLHQDSTELGIAEDSDRRRKRLEVDLVRRHSRRLVSFAFQPWQRQLPPLPRELQRHPFGPHFLFFGVWGRLPLAHRWTLFVFQPTIRVESK